MNKVFLLFFLFATFFNTQIAYSEGVPQGINYQGILTSPDPDKPLEGHHKITFHVYDVPVGGVSTWGPQIFESVLLVDGRFNVILGPQDTHAQPRSIVDAFSSPGAYLEITVGDGANPILPRQQILSVPYAIKSGTASKVVPDGITSEMVADGSITRDDQEPINIKKSGLAEGESYYVGTTFKKVTTNGTILELEITTTGRPVFVGVEYVSFGGIGIARIVRDNSEVVGYTAWVHNNAMPTSLWCIDDKALKGTHTYHLEVNGMTGSERANVADGRLVAYEL